ncbi:MAG: tetratricopeptide repeat protein [Gemmataceae bacterium]
MIRPNTPQVGETVYAFKHDVWWPAEVLAAYPNGRILVHYPGRLEMGEDELSRGQYRLDVTGIRASLVMPSRTESELFDDRSSTLPSIRKPKPKNTMTGKVIAGFALTFALGLVLIWWHTGPIGIPDLIATDNQRALNACSRGNALLNRKQFQKAVKEFDTALELKPRFFEAVHNRGVAYSRLEKHKHAIDDFTKAIEIRPRDPQGYFNRGISYWERQQYAKAIEDYTKVVELSPGDDSAYFNRGLAYSKQGDYEKAASDFERVAGLVAKGGRRHRDAKIQLRQVRVMIVQEARNLALNQGKVKEGLAMLDRIVKRDPQDKQARYSRAQIYSQLKKYKSALADFNELAKQDPNNDVTYTARAFVHQALKDYPKALADRRKVVQLYQRQRNPDSRAVALANNNLAWFLCTCPVEKLRNGEEAIPLAIKACRATKWKDGMYLDTLAAAFAEAGHFELAVAYQIQALADRNFIGRLKPEELEEAKKRLELFQDGKKWVEP